VKDLKSGGGSLWTNGSTGSFVYKAGSKAYIGGSAAANVRIGETSDAINATGKFIALDSGAEFTFEKNKYTLSGAATVQQWTVSDGDTFEIEANGVLTVATGGGAKNFMLIGPDSNASTAGGKLIGAGKLVVGETEVVGGTGGWQVTGGASVIFSATTAEASFILSSTGTLAGGTGASITQKAGTVGNALTLMSVTLDLSTAGSLVLTSGSNPAKVTLAETTGIIKTGTSTGGSSLSSSGFDLVGTKAITSLTIGISSGAVTANYEDTGKKLGSLAGGHTDGASVVPAGADNVTFVKDVVIGKSG
jgi:hypothetical protein